MKIVVMGGQGLVGSTPTWWPSLSRRRSSADAWFELDSCGENQLRAGRIPRAKKKTITVLVQLRGQDHKFEETNHEQRTAQKPGHH
jgi:hypothetical protein